MTKVDIFSGFLGAGKTTLIKKLIEEAYKEEKIVLIENEFGDIGIDGGFLKESGVQINEMNSGCICCTLVGDFSRALEDVMNQFMPDRILIEPSGVGKLSDVITAVKNLKDDRISLNSFTTVVDAKKCVMYMGNFGEFFNNQIEYANCLILSHTDAMGAEAVNEIADVVRKLNKDATLVTTDWEELEGKQILQAMEKTSTMETVIAQLDEEAHQIHGHHHEHGEHCGCGGHHDHEHHHEDKHHDHGHHHEHGEHCECGGHHDHEHHHEGKHHDHEHHHEDKHHDHGHHHEHGEHCACGGHHHSEGHHHADEVFDSIGFETSRKYTKEEMEEILDELDDSRAYGQVLRSKGIVNGDKWIHFDYVPGEGDVRHGAADVIGRIVVIGVGLNKEAIKSLFQC
ncbi:MAG: GTP-binding protein [Peptostreptococcaceae bacterium]|nr:GTP-binding protein [Peptostreptococcaceae bacterium]